MNFVETYRSLTKIPEPNFAVVKMNELIAECAYPDEEGGAKEKYRMTTSVEPDTIEVQIDEQMIEQVLINLIKNSVQALKGRQGADDTDQGLL